MKTRTKKIKSNNFLSFRFLEAFIFSPSNKNSFLKYYHRQSNNQHRFSVHCTLQKTHDHDNVERKQRSRGGGRKQTSLFYHSKKKKITLLSSRKKINVHPPKKTKTKTNVMRHKQVIVNTFWVRILLFILFFSFFFFFVCVCM